MSQPQGIAINTLPFWSRFVLRADLRYDGANLLRTVLSRGSDILAFDYRRGENNVSALDGAQATSRDTLMTKANQTRGGSQYTIRGVSITKDGMPYAVPLTSDGTPAQGAGALVHELYPPSAVQPANGAFGPQAPSPADFRALDAFAWNVLQKFMGLRIEIDGTKRIVEMGPSLLYPGVGGPLDFIETTNAGTIQRNFMEIPEGIVWNPSGAVDSSFVAKFTAAYDCRAPTYVSPFGTANGLPVAPGNPALPGAVPSALGRVWEFGYVINFHGVEESPVSNVS